MHSNFPSGAFYSKVFSSARSTRNKSAMRNCVIAFGLKEKCYQEKVFHHTFNKLLLHKIKSSSFWQLNAMMWMALTFLHCAFSNVFDTSYGSSYQRNSSQVSSFWSSGPAQVLGFNFLVEKSAFQNLPHLAKASEIRAEARCQ